MYCQKWHNHWTCYSAMKIVCRKQDNYWWVVLLAPNTSSVQTTSQWQPCLQAARQVVVSRILTWDLHYISTIKNFLVFDKGSQKLWKQRDMELPMYDVSTSDTSTTTDTTMGQLKYWILLLSVAVLCTDYNSNCTGEGVKIWICQVTLVHK